jgi:hypothetical protein
VLSERLVHYFWSFTESHDDQTMINARLDATSLEYHSLFDCVHSLASIPPAATWKQVKEIDERTISKPEKYM